MTSLPGRGLRARPSARTALMASCALAAAALLPACASGKTEAAGTDCAAPGVTADEVKIGLVFSDSGFGSEALRPVRGGVDARLGLANEAGGVHGRAIKYDWRDDTSDASVNSRVVQELTSKNDVFALIEMTTVAGGGAERLTAADVPVLGLGLGPDWVQRPNMVTFAAFAPVDTFGRYVSSQGGTRAVLVRDPFNPAAQVVGENLTASLAAAGIETVGTVEYRPGGDSPARAGQQIAESGADVLVGAVEAEAYAAVLAGARAAGAELKVALSSAGYDQRFLQKVGAQAAGMSVYVLSRAFEERTPAIVTYRDGMARFAPYIQPTDQEHALTAYIVTDMLIAGLERAGRCPTRESFLAALRGMKDYDAGGLVPPVNLDPAAGELGRCLAFVRVNAMGSGFDVIEPSLCGESLRR